MAEEPSPKIIRYSYQKKLVTAHCTDDFEVSLIAIHVETSGDINCCIFAQTSKQNAREGTYHLLHVVCDLTYMTHEPPAFQRAARIEVPPSEDVTLYMMTGSLLQMEFIGADTWKEVRKGFNDKTIVYLRDSGGWLKRLARRIRGSFTSPQGARPSEQPKQKATQDSMNP